MDDGRANPLLQSPNKQQSQQQSQCAILLKRRPNLLCVVCKGTSNLAIKPTPSDYHETHVHWTGSNPTQYVLKNYLGSLCTACPGFLAGMIHDMQWPGLKNHSFASSLPLRHMPPRATTSATPRGTIARPYVSSRRLTQTHATGHMQRSGLHGQRDDFPLPGRCLGAQRLPLRRPRSRRVRPLHHGRRLREFHHPILPSRRLQHSGNVLVFNRRPVLRATACLGLDTRLFCGFRDCCREWGGRKRGGSRSGLRTPG